MTYQTILVATDGSERSYLAVRRAAQLAETLDTKLVLVRVVEDDDRTYHLDDREAGDSLGYELVENDPLAGANAAVAEVAGLDPIPAVIAGGVVDGIIDAAHAYDTDLVVVGNRGVGSLPGRLLGTVAIRVLHDSPCDVLIVDTEVDES